jgi:hypothetical protein
MGKFPNCARMTRYTKTVHEFAAEEFLTAPKLKTAQGA